MTVDHDRLARVALSRLGEPGDPRLSSLVAELGAEEVRSLLGQTRDGTGVYADVAARLDDLDPERDLDRAQRQGIRFIVPGDDEWPESMDDLRHAEPVQRRAGAPLGLWARGPRRLDEVAERSIAVVGSRSATTYGTGVAGEIAAHVGQEGWTVVSGAAFGIDQAAHRGALAARAPTVAVLACGVDRAYPTAHRQLLDYVADTGVIVSELPPGCAPTRLRFLARNRLIAALTCGTVVVEAALRSGALNTANWAGRLNRPVMGVPVPVTSAPSEGVHQLIRLRDASLVTSGADVLDLVAPVGAAPAPERRGPDTPRDALDHDERQVLDAVPRWEPVGTLKIAGVAGPRPRGWERYCRRYVTVGSCSSRPQVRGDWQSPNPGRPLSVGWGDGRTCGGGPARADGPGPGGL